MKLLDSEGYIYTIEMERYIRKIDDISDVIQFIDLNLFLVTLKINGSVCIYEYINNIYILLKCIEGNIRKIGKFRKNKKKFLYLDAGNVYMVSLSKEYIIPVNTHGKKISNIINEVFLDCEGTIHTITPKKNISHIITYTKKISEIFYWFCLDYQNNLYRIIQHNVDIYSFELFDICDYKINNILWKPKNFYYIILSKKFALYYVVDIIADRVKFISKWNNIKTIVDGLEYPLLIFDDDSAFFIIDGILSPSDIEVKNKNFCCNYKKQYLVKSARNIVNSEDKIE